MHDSNVCLLRVWLAIAASFLPLLVSSPICASNAEAQTLAELRSGKVDIVLEHVLDGYEFRMKPIGGPAELGFELSAKVFALKEPSRLVIDLPKTGAGADRKFNLKDATLTTLRLGEHSDKTRFVIDIKSKESPEFSVESDPNGEFLVVKFIFPEDSPRQLEELTPSPIPTVDSAKTAENQVDPLTQPTPAPSNTTFVMRENQRLDSDPIEPLKPQLESKSPEQTVETPLPASTSQDSSSHSGPTVSGIYFQAPPESKTGSVVIEAPGLSNYQLNPIKDDLYELVLPETKLAGKHLLLPQFPPDSFSGFQAVIARETSASVEIKIHVSKGTKLMPSFNGNQLWIKVVGSK